MFGWFNRARARPSRVKRSAKAGSVANACGKNLQRDEALQFRLAGLENESHSALADQFEDFQLRKSCRHFVEGRRGPCFCAFGGDGGLEEDIWDKALAALPQGWAARTWDIVSDEMYRSYPFLRHRWAEVTRNLDWREERFGLILQFLIGLG